MSSKDESVKPFAIYRYFFHVPVPKPFMKWANLLLVPSTIVLERYIAPLIIAVILNDIQHGTVNLSSAMWLLVGYGAIQLFAQVIGYRLILFCMWAVEAHGTKRLYDELYKKVIGHSLDFFNNQFVGSLVSQSNKFVTAYINFWNLITYKVLFVATSVLATIIGLSVIMWQFALIVLVLVIAFAIAANYGMKFLRPRFRARSESYSKISGALSDSFSNIQAIKMDGMESRELTEVQKYSQAVSRAEIRARNSFIGVSSVYSFIIALMRIGALVASILAVQYGFASAGLVYISLTYSFNLIEEIWNISDIIRDHHQIISDSEEMYGILHKAHEVKDVSSKQLTVSNAHVSFARVTFQHKDSDDALFDGFTLDVPKGQKIGIVGVSGSGKTTLTKLLLRFMDIDNGVIEIDGQNIAKVSQKSLHRAIAYVPQEPILFHRSIAENIGYSRVHATLEEIRHAAKRAHADSFIENLADGYDTTIGERGIKLSGGQRQRIAIARAILKDAPILILDEATSALDSESELLIQKAIENLWHNKTTIVIAHRLSTISRLDRIIVMDNGTIVEDGTHKELLAKHGVYAKLWRHQSGGFIDEQEVMDSRE